MKPTLLLFDIDGTLLQTGGAGRRALIGAFADELARGDVVEQVDLRGMTDLALFHAAIAAAGGTPSPALLARLTERYLVRLEGELARTGGELVLPGVREVLAAAAGRPDLSLGLGTGNLERGAQLKLARAGLTGIFTFGGFGDDAAERAALLRAGVDRGARRLGGTAADCRVVVIGDTPRDVSAARAIGARSVAVATGGFTLAALAAAGADVTLTTLAEPDAIPTILGPEPPERGWGET